MSVTKKSLNIAPSAAVLVKLAEDGNLPAPNATLLMARLAVEQGLGDLPITRFSLTLNVKDENE